MGGSSKTETKEKPPHIVEAEKDALAMANYLSKLGYMPRTGVQIAGLSDRTLDSMRGTNSGLEAFGLPTSDVTANIPQTTTSASGIEGYTTTSGLDELIATMQKDRPAQYKYIMDMFIDPVTGEMPSGSPFNANSATTASTGDETMDYIQSVGGNAHHNDIKGYEKDAFNEAHHRNVANADTSGRYRKWHYGGDPSGYINPIDQIFGGYSKKYDMSKD
tara:strand:+ start:588 stop:1241 length:654 start_codon:yes stop_codon:yes gene_type:complete